MFRSFGERMLQFARSVDIVDDTTVKQVTNLVEEYLDRTLDIGYVRILKETMIDDKLGLMKYKLDLTNLSVSRLRDEDGNYQGQMSYSYGEKSCLWIVSEDTKKDLCSTDEYIDLWSGKSDLPDYLQRNETEAEVKTSIIVLLKNPKTKVVFGVINFEANEYLEITQQAKKELQNISKTISLLFYLFDHRASQKENTESAITHLRKSLSGGDLPRLTKPSIFLASSSKAEEDAVGIIKSVLNEFDGKIKVVYWKDISEPGNINSQLISAIGECRFGICYFSEINAQPDESREFSYQDNPNVLFEAGMLHGRMGDGSSPTSWIPVREEDSPPAPFDFASERMIVVPRNSEGKINEEAFKTQIRGLLETMMNHMDA